MTKRSRKPHHGDDYEARKAQILRAAARLIHRKGFAATRIEDVAKAAKLTKAGLYYYFPTKGHLLVAIMEHALERMEEEVLEPGLSEQDPEARLRVLVSRHARLMIEEQDLLSILFDEVDRVTPRVRRHLMARQRRYVETLRDSFRKLKAAGRVRIDPTVATFNLLGAVLWLPRWFSQRGRLSSDQVVCQTTRAILEGLLVP